MFSYCCVVGDVVGCSRFLYVFQGLPILHLDKRGESSKTKEVCPSRLLVLNFKDSSEGVI